MALFRTGLYVKDHSVEKLQVASTPIASFNGNVTGLYIPELIAYITAKQSGSGTPAPDNIRPISGVSECNVVRCGKNFFSRERDTTQYYINSSGTLVSSSVWSVSDYISIKGNVTYTLRTNSAGGANPCHCFFDENGSFISSITTANNVVRFTTPLNAAFARFSYRTESTNVQLEVGSTATAYEAYTGNTYTIQLGDTYYGGSLDVTTGVLTVLYKLVLLNGSQTIFSSNWSVGGYVSYNPSDIGITEGFTSLQSDCYGATGTNKISIYNNRILINDSRIGDTITKTSEWNANLVEHNVQVMYELATPITVQLTPMQIEQLLGANNVWADTGNVAVKFNNVIR